MMYWTFSIWCTKDQSNATTWPHLYGNAVKRYSFFHRCSHFYHQWAVIFVFTDAGISIRSFVCFPDPAVSYFMYHRQHINIKIATILSNGFRNCLGFPYAQLCLSTFRYLYLTTQVWKNIPAKLLMQVHVGLKMLNHQCLIYEITSCWIWTQLLLHWGTDL